MLLNIINYAVRIIIVILGLLLLSGVVVPRNIGSDQSAMLKVMGGIFILWGIYRIITYYSHQKRYFRKKNEDE